MRPWARGQPPPHVDRPRPWRTAGPPGHCRRGGTTGKAVSLCTECWQGDNQYFCTGHLGSCPAQSPPRLGLGIQSSCLLSPGGRKLRKEGTTGQSAPSAQLAPGLQGATAGEKKSISRWGRSKNQQRHPAHQPQRGTKARPEGDGQPRQQAGQELLAHAHWTQDPSSGAGERLAVGPVPGSESSSPGSPHVIPPALQHHGHTTS